MSVNLVDGPAPAADENDSAADGQINLLFETDDHFILLPNAQQRGAFRAEPFFILIVIVQFIFPCCDTFYIRQWACQQEMNKI